MNWKLRLLIIVIKIITFPIAVIFAIKRLIARLLGNAPADASDDVKLYRRTNDKLEFVYAIHFTDQILEQHGVVGEIAPRQYHSLDKKEEIAQRVQKYLDDGYLPAEAFDGFSFMVLSAAVEADFADSGEMDLRNAFWEALDEFLADTGLGFVSGASNGMGTMDLDLEVVDADLAKKSILNHFSGTKYSSFNKFESFDGEPQPE